MVSSSGYYGLESLSIFKEAVENMFGRNCNLIPLEIQRFNKTSVIKTSGQLDSGFKYHCP